MKTNAIKKPALPAAARELIERFALELAEMIQRDARESLIAALGLSPAAKSTRAPARASKPAKSGKRDPAELERLAGRLLAYVKGHPGQGIEQIASGIGTPTRELTLPMKKLVGSKSLRKKGERRATKYFHAAAA